MSNKKLIKLTLLDFLGGSEAEVFASTLESNAGTHQLVLHAKASAGLLMLRERLQQTLNGLNSDIDVVLHMHEDAEFAHNKSLQDVVEAFGSGEIIYDPVNAIQNSRAALAQSIALRELQSGSVSGVYYSANNRELYLTLADQKTDTTRINNSGSFNVNVVKQLSSITPLIAVDKASVKSANDAWYGAKSAKQFALTASLLVFVGLAQAPDARAEDPAVSAPNGKIGIEAGDYDGTGGAVAHGAFSVPVSQSYGVQIDGAAGHYLDASYRGVGAHLFWRDPDRGLLGLIGSYEKLGSIDQNRLGAEGEAYFDTTSLRLRAGYQGGDVKDGAFIGARGRWYANENLALSIAYENAAGKSNGKAGIEWQPEFSGLSGLSIFGEAEVAANSYNREVIGLRYYFGANKSLIHRHRQDDPDELFLESTQNLGKGLHDSRVQPTVTPPGGPICPIPSPYGCAL